MSDSMLRQRALEALERLPENATAVDVRDRISEALGCPGEQGSEKGRGRLSSPLALLIAVILGVFGFAALLRPTSASWLYWLIFLWTLLVSAALCTWAVLPKTKAGKPLIGNTTLSMVAGVSSGIIAAIALVAQLRGSTVAEQRDRDLIGTIQAQNNLIRKQSDALDAALSQLRSLSTGPQSMSK